MLSPGSAFRDAEFVKPEGFTPTFHHKGILDTILSATNIPSHDKTPILPQALGAEVPKIPTVFQRIVRFEESVFDISFNTQDQVPDILDVNSDGKVTHFRRTLDSKESLTIVLLQQDLVHGDQLKFLLLFSMILTTT